MNPYYQDSAVTIFHGDCREILPQLEPVDSIITDPMYGIGLEYGDKTNDDLQTFKDSVSMIFAFTKPASICISVSRLYDLPYCPQWTGVFRKKIGFCALRSYPFYPHWEPIIFYHVKGDFAGNKRHRSDVFEFVSETPSKIGHPTPKPLGLMTALIELIGEEMILDPFMGSGTTLRAAKDLGRKAIGIEIEEKYCEIAAKRMSQEVLEFGKG